MSAESPARPLLVVVMGVTGSGKTTVGQALARSLGVEYSDADSLHSAENVAKMASGHPLTDEDRAPWLRSVGRWLAEHDDVGGVTGCSALRRPYRDVLRDCAHRVVFLHLAGDSAVLAQRVADRPGHFMPASLISSQLTTLEPLEVDERGSTLELTASVDEIVSAFRATWAGPPGVPGT